MRPSEDQASMKVVNAHEILCQKDQFPPIGSSVPRALRHIPARRQCSLTALSFWEAAPPELRMPVTWPALQTCFEQWL